MEDIIQYLLYFIWVMMIISLETTKKLEDKASKKLEKTMDNVNDLIAELNIKRSELNARILAYNLMIYPDFPEARGKPEPSKLKFSQNAWKN